MGDKRVGFVGLGIMGRPMAINLLKAGYEVAGYDRNHDKTQAVAAEGAAAGTSAAEAAAGASATVVMVQDSANSEEAVLGPGGVLEGASAGSTVIDMSSIAPGTSQKLAAACEAKGVDFLDAPVSGGEPKAIDGSLAIMVGGKADVFERHVGLLNAMGSSAVLCGGYGAGNTTKLANQIIVAANIEAVGEALVLAVRAGLDPGTVFQAIRGGLAGSAVMDAKAPMMIAGNFEPRLPHQPPPEGPQQRPHHRRRARRPPARNQPGQADGRRTHQRRQGRRRPLRHSHLHRRHGQDEDQRAGLDRRRKWAAISRRCAA